MLKYHLAGQKATNECLNFDKRTQESVFLLMVHLFITTVLNIIVLTFTNKRIFMLLFVRPDHHVLLTVVKVGIVGPTPKTFLLIVILLRRLLAG